MLIIDRLFGYGYETLLIAPYACRLLETAQPCPTSSFSGPNLKYRSPNDLTNVHWYLRVIEKVSEDFVALQKPSGVINPA